MHRRLSGGRPGPDFITKRLGKIFLAPELDAIQRELGIHQNRVLKDQIDKKIVELRSQGHKVKEIARMVGVSQKAVHRTLSKARKGRKNG